MKTTQTTRRGFTLVELLVVIVIIASLAGLTAPMVIRQRKKADQTEAVNNARQIGLAMFEFETEYGSYPDDDTINDVDTTVYAVSAPTSSNDAFQQLFAAGITLSEEMFYAKISGTSKPDGTITALTDVLSTGENAFGYIMDTGGVAISSAGNPSQILVATPFASATTFATEPFDSKAVILRLDNSVTSVRINSTGIAQQGGNDILSATESEFWGTVTPTVLEPDL